MSEEEEIRMVTLTYTSEPEFQSLELHLNYLERAETFPLKLIKGPSLPFCHKNLRIIRLTLESTRNLLPLTKHL